MNFIEFTNEQLVKVIQDGNDTYGSAFSELNRRYAERIDALVARSHAHSPKIAIQDWASHFAETFWEAVRKFDVENTSGVLFEPYLFWKFKNRSFDLIRSKMYERKKDAFQLKQDVIIVSSDAQQPVESVEDFYTFRSDPKADIEVSRQSTNTELFEFIRSKSIEHAEFLEWKLAGYEYREIAAKMGRVGTPASMRNWGKRMVQRIQQIVIEFYKQSQTLDELSAYVGQQIMERLQNGLTVGQRELSSMA